MHIISYQYYSVFEVNIDCQSLLVYDHDCAFSSRRSSWALQWGGDWRYRVSCENWCPSPRPAGQQGQLLEILYWPSSTTSYGLVFQFLLLNTLLFTSASSLISLENKSYWYVIALSLSRFCLDHVFNYLWWCLLELLSFNTSLFLLKI